MPFLVANTAPDPEPGPVAITDAIRIAVLLQQRDHCAPSTFGTFARSLRARGYPRDPTPYMRSN